MAGQEIARLKPTEIVAGYEADFGKVLPDTFKAETFVRLAQGILRRDGDLYKVAEANPNSLMVALLNAARLGHEPGTDEYYLTPRGIKKGMVTKAAEVVGIEGYKGIVKRMLNHSRVLNVVAEAVFANDPFRYVPGEDERPWHNPDWFEREDDGRGLLLGSYAYASLTGGATSRVVVLGPRQLNAAEKAAADFSFLWKGDNRETAYRKTALRRLEPYVPKSSHLLYAQADRDVAAAEIATERGLPELPPSDLPGGEGEVVEAEVVDEHPPADNFGIDPTRGEQP